jgi:hypothetical protein
MSVSIPAMVTPTPTSISTIYSQPQPFGPTSTFYKGFLNPSDLPASSVDYYKEVYAPGFTSYCSVPSYYRTGLVSPTGSDATVAATATATATPEGPGRVTNSNAVQCDPVYKYYDSYWAFESTYICSDGSYYVSSLCA